jgi:hypothetical protein
MQLPKPSEGGTFELVPPGTYMAICYRFIDCGTHASKFDGKIRHEVMLSWELPDELMADGRPFAVSKRYRWSMHEKSNLRKTLEAWRGRAFTTEDFEGPQAFNTRKLLGAPCMLTITHDVKPDKTYTNIAGIGKLVKGMQPPPPQNKIVYLALTEEGWDSQVYSELSDTMKQIIAGSPEYAELMQKLRRNDDPGNDGSDMIYDDPLPF